MTSEQPIPWEQVVPSASNISPQSITRDALLDMFLAGQKPGLNFLLIDVRREDHKGSSIAGSLNMPIQTLAGSLPTIHLLCKAAGIRTAIFFCGHSTGRGPRAAGLFDDELRRSREDTDIKSMVLTDGFNGWSAAGGAFNRFITP